MNFWVLLAGILGFFTSFLHIFGGQVDPVRPFLKSDLPAVPKATLLACWHLVSVVLLFSGGILTYAGWYDSNNLSVLVVAISIIFVVFAVVFIFVGFYFFKANTFIKLPQWILLLPIGVLGLIGVM